MHLYTISLDAYTFSEEEIEIEQVDNRRYTMRDIGKLEKELIMLNIILNYLY